MDRDKLLAFLEQKTEWRSTVLTAIYEGLADRIRNGDFDTKEVK